MGRDHRAPLYYEGTVRFLSQRLVTGFAAPESRELVGRDHRAPHVLADLLQGPARCVVPPTSFIYREEVGAGELDVEAGVELHSVKQRNGPLGKVPVQFDAPTMHFRNASAYAAPAGYLSDVQSPGPPGLDAGGSDTHA